MLKFRSVNCRASVGYRNGWHRHHLIPRQLAADGVAGPVLASVAPLGFSFDDFARNGILLPASEAVARTSGLPVHTGPHSRYNRRVAALVAAVGRQSPHPVRRLAGVFFIQHSLRRTLRQPHAFPVSIDSIDLALDKAAQRRLDAEVAALLMRFAQLGQIA